MEVVEDEVAGSLNNFLGAGEALVGESVTSITVVGVFDDKKFVINN